MSSASRTTTGRMAASADRKGSSVRGRTLPRGRWVRPYAAWRRISALPGTTRYIEPATAPMMRPACPIATSRTSSRPNDELTADAIASKSAARSRAPLSSSRAPCSRRVMPRMRIRAIVSSTNAMMNSTEVTSRTDAISKYTLPGSGIRHRLTPGEARLVPGCRPGSQLYSVPTWSRSLSTTRRRTISEAEIALFGALAGDFSPLTIDVSHAGARFAPPALLVAVAIGLGTMDMPVPSVAEWEWLNWKFPRPVKAGETIYARWTLTQKRPPVGGAPTAIVVWRVDVHTADGALCAEGEVGASVRRQTQAARPRTAEAT